MQGFFSTRLFSPDLVDNGHDPCGYRHADNLHYFHDDVDVLPIHFVSNSDVRRNNDLRANLTQ